MAPNHLDFTDLPSAVHVYLYLHLIASSAQNKQNKSHKLQYRCCREASWHSAVQRKACQLGVASSYIIGQANRSGKTNPSMGRVGCKGGYEGQGRRGAIVGGKSVESKPAGHLCFPGLVFTADNSQVIFLITL